MNTQSLLETLIGFPTVSHDSNLELIGFIHDFLRARGAQVTLIRDSTGRKANLFAHLGPAGVPGILLSGHTDVVPVEGQHWTTDPFQLTRKEDRLYGRGTADMKGFIACALNVADQASRGQLRTPLQLAFSHDEEIGCVGVRSLIQSMRTWHHLPASCVIGEPTQMRLALGHKGKTALRATCHGRPAHSANPARGVNAIYLANDLINQVRQQQAQLIHHGAKDPAYEVPHTTLHVGTIQGGTALNILPAGCELELEIRNIAADDPDQLIHALRERARAIALDADPQARIELQVTNAYPGLETSAQTYIATLIGELTGGQAAVKVGFGSEGGLFSGHLGIPTVICGPGCIDQAHKADEFITVDQLQQCDHMLDRLLQRLI